MADEGQEEETVFDRDAHSEESWNEESGSGIGELLDEGYALLDGFVSWLEEKARISTRIAQQDCFNAESLIDYLANNHRKPIQEINEFELRWFLFSHYIRKAMADVETEERLPDSLHRFFNYLAFAHTFTIQDWILSVLDDRTYYLKRRRDYAELDLVDEQIWEEGFRSWCEELEDDLDLRCLWLPGDLGSGIARTDLMGWREATLQEEANQLWQSMRTTLLSQGLDYETVREQLTSAFHQWVSAPQERLEGQSPREIILAERQERIEE